MNDGNCHLFNFSEINYCKMTLLLLILYESLPEVAFSPQIAVYVVYQRFYRMHARCRGYAPGLNLTAGLCLFNGATSG